MNGDHAASALDERVVDALRTVYDPCCREKRISVVDMGLIDHVHIEKGSARVELVLTSGWCPFAVDLLSMVQETVASLPELDGAEVEIRWDKAWGTDRLSADARRKLRFLPDPGSVADRDDYVADHAPRATAEQGAER